MGCDIHGVFQTKDDDGKWTDVPHCLRFQRDYTLFGVLAGVRHYPEDVAPVAEGRGYPDGFEVDDRDHHPTDPECLDEWGRRYALTCRRRRDPEERHEWMGDHSFSWATGEEMIAWWKANGAKYPSTEYFFAEVRELTLTHRTLRFVFGFDS